MNGLKTTCVYQRRANETFAGLLVRLLTVDTATTDLTPQGQTSTALHFRSNLRDGVLGKISNSQHKSTQRCRHQGRHHKIALMTKLGVH